jgi:hypothetical protein
MSAAPSSPRIVGAVQLKERETMDKSILLIGILTLSTVSTAFAINPTDGGVIVSSHRRGQSLDDRAIYACARTMVTRMFPGKEPIRVYASTGGEQVFDDFTDDTLLGYQMAVLLTATDAKTGALLGTAECDVAPTAQVVALKPGVKDLSPDASVVMVE